jgi:Zn-dependent metalloprotease
VRSRSLAILATAVMAVALVAGPVVAARPERAPGRAAERALLEQLDPDTRVTRDRDSGDIRSIRGDRGPVASARSLGRPATPAAAARAFIGRYGGLFGVDASERDVTVARVDRTGARGATYVRLQQRIDGVPVLGGDLVVVLDRSRNVRAARGEASRDRSVDTRARISPSTAMRAARDAVARATGVPVSRLRAATPTRWILDPRLLDAPGLPYARLVWRTDVRDAIGAIDWFVAVDARTGDVALRFDQRPSGLPADAPQRICNQGGQRENVVDRLPCLDGAKEVAPFTGDELAAKNATEAAYDVYRLRFGYDLAGELGGTLISTVNYCPRAAGGGCPYQNAFWNGSQMVYGAGLATADDVVGHELTHGVTERASNLFYYMESGAINEALSDIFGEAIDLTSGSGDAENDRWKIGEDLTSIGVIRNMKNPTLFGHPDSMDSPLWDDDPSETDSGGVHSNSGVANKAFYLMVEGPTPFDGDRDIALDQAIAIWFLASQSLLTSGSDHADLADALQIACDQLAAGPTGAIKNQAGNASADLVSADCEAGGALHAALASTRMRWADRTTGTKPVALCTDPAANPEFLLASPINPSGSGWTFDVSGDRRWYTQDWYALPDALAEPGSADPWALIGEDLARTADRRVRRTNSVEIPASDRPVFLWFRHAYGFDDGSEDLVPNGRAYDGGVVEVSANGGPWQDLRPLFLSGGPTKTIFKGDTNPLKGRIGYGAESGGFVTARANLSGTPALSFGGKNVKLSFRIGTDSAYAGEGWFIDDVRIYQCVNARESNAPDVGQPVPALRTGSMSAGGAVPVRVTTTIDGEGAIASRVTAGAAVVGGTIKGTTIDGTMPTTATTQELTWIATDENGDQGTEDREVTVRRLEQTAFSFGGGSWSTQSSSGFSGGSARWAKAAGRTASITATASSFALVTRTGPDRGKARVCLDGGSCVTVDLYSKTAGLRRLAAVFTKPSPGSHTLSVKVLGTKNAKSTGTRVDVDALVTAGY